MDFDREQLAKALGGNRVLVAQFEALASDVASASEQSTAAVDATATASTASYVTLSPNSSLGNEYVLTGEGITIDASQPGKAIIRARVRTQSGEVQFLTQAAFSKLLLPPTGRLATTAGEETFSNKTLDGLRLGTTATAVAGTADRKIEVVVGGVTMYLLASST